MTRRSTTTATITDSTSGTTRASVTRRFREPLHDVYNGLVTLCRPARIVAATSIAIPAWGLECIGFALIARDRVKANHECKFHGCITRVAAFAAS